MFTSLRRLDRLFGGRRTRHSDHLRSGSHRLRLESLEDRRLLTVGSASGVADLVSSVTDSALLGAAASGPSVLGRFATSADGRYVAFWSSATNLVAGDTNAQPDVFVKDTQSGVIRIASSDSSGNQANGRSDHPAVAADSTHVIVVFRSDADNLVSGDTLGNSDVFIKEFSPDLTPGATTRVSTNSAGDEAYGDCDSPSISADGRYVAFASAAGNLASPDGSLGTAIFRQGRTDRHYEAHEHQHGRRGCRNRLLAARPQRRRALPGLPDRCLEPVARRQ